MRKLRILLLAPVRLEGIGGAERHINNFIAVLQGLGHEVHVQSEADARPLRGLKALVARKVPALKSAFFTSRLSVDTRAYDFVLSFDLSGVGVRNHRHLRVLAGCAAAFRLKALVPESRRVRRMARELITEAYRRMELRASRGLGNVACSDGLAREVAAIGLRLAGTIDPPTDLQALADSTLSRADALAALGLPADGRYLAFVGRWEYAKGSDLLTKVADTLPADTWLVLAGPSPEQLPDAVRRKTRFCASVPAQDIHRVYRAADAVLLPTRFEGSSMVVTEALACGTPVLTTPVGSGVDLRDHSPELASLVIGSLNDATPWVRALARLQEPTHRQAVLAAARDFIQRYAPAAVAEQWQALFKVILCREFS